MAFLRYVYNIGSNATFLTEDRENKVFEDPATYLECDTEKRQLEQIWETKFNITKELSITLNPYVEEELLYGAHYVIVYVDHPEVHKIVMISVTTINFKRSLFRMDLGLCIK